MQITKVQICNLALSQLGKRGTIENIESPMTDNEKVFAQWYDLSRRATLRRMMPSFAQRRVLLAKDENYVPAFGYKNAYKVPSDCLKVLGLGNVEDRVKPKVEGGYILTDLEFEKSELAQNFSGYEANWLDEKKNFLPLRYVFNEKDESKFTDDFVDVFALILAGNVCYGITESDDRKKMIEGLLQTMLLELAAVDAQENPPIKVDRSPILESRMTGFIRRDGKI